MRNKFWIILASILLWGCLVSCESKTPDTTTDTTPNDATDTAAVTETEAVTTSEYDPGLPDITFDGAAFTVLHYDATMQRYYITVDEDKTSEVIGDAAYRRNTRIEETYGVTIAEQAGAGNKTTKELTNAVYAGDGTYDVIIPHSSEGYASMITTNLVRDLKGVEIIDLSRKWWYPGALEHLTIADRVYFTSCYYTVTCQNFFGLLYNLDLLNALGLSSPTDLALSGDWTLDLMQTMMAAATSDLNGDGTMNGDDRYGFVTSNNIMYPFMTGFGQVSTAKNEESRPVLVLNNNTVIDIVDKMNRMVAGGDLYFGTYANQKYLLDNFNGGRALFSMFGIGTYYNVMRELEPDFGLLPLPKYNEEQKSYYTLRADSYVAIPSVVNDIEKTGIILEALSASSMELVYPAFKEEVLYAKCLRDEASSKVLDLFFDSTIYDIGMTYCTDRTLSRLLDQYKNVQEIAFASLYASKSAGIQKQLDTLFEYIQTEKGIKDDKVADTLNEELKAQAQAEDRVKNMIKIETEKFELSRTDTIMEGWPDLIRTSSGKLICVYNECVGHGNRDHSKISLRESTDDGKTWSEPRYVDVETFQGDQWNSIRLSQLSDGRLILVCDRIDDHERTDTTEIWMWESTDDGVTWSEGIRHGIYGYCADKVRELKDGTLLLLVSSYNSGMGRSVVYAHRSTDGGKTWSERITVASDTRYNLIEPAVLETSNGTLVAFMRENSGRNYDCMRAISKDGGKTWEGVYPISIPGCHRPAIGYLSDGRIMLTYRSYIDKVKRVTAAAVFDEATAVSTQNDPEKVVLYQLDYDEHKSPDTGYTAWVELTDNKVIMVNYIMASAPRAFIRGYFFQTSDLK